MARRLIGALRGATNTMVELVVIYLLVILASALLYALFEHVGFGDSLWWASVTATTTGYGDMAPKTVPGRLVAFLLMHLSVFLVIPLIVARIITGVIDNSDAFTHGEQERLKAQLDRIEAKLDRDAR